MGDKTFLKLIIASIAAIGVGFVVYALGAAIAGSILIVAGAVFGAGTLAYYELFAR